MEEIYRGHRISVRPSADNEGWTAKIWTVQGQVTQLHAGSSAVEGAEKCLHRARQVIDHFITYRDRH